MALLFGLAALTGNFFGLDEKSGVKNRKATPNTILGSEPFGIT